MVRFQCFYSFSQNSGSWKFRKQPKAINPGIRSEYWYEKLTVLDILPVVPGCLCAGAFKPRSNGSRRRSIHSHTLCGFPDCSGACAISET